jgi:hypothetical protein
VAAGTPRSALTCSPTGGCPGARRGFPRQRQLAAAGIPARCCRGRDLRRVGLRVVLFRVQRADPRHARVYRSIRHPRRGRPIDITDPQSPQRARQQLREAGTYIDFTWALVLKELPDHRTRLLVRTRASYAPHTPSGS